MEDLPKINKYCLKCSRKILSKTNILQDKYGNYIIYCSDCLENGFNNQNDFEISKGVNNNNKILPLSIDLEIIKDKKNKPKRYRIFENIAKFFRKCCCYFTNIFKK